MKGPAVLCRPHHWCQCPTIQSHALQLLRAPQALCCGASCLPCNGAAVEQHITYERELHAGDLVTIHSSVLEIKDKSIRFQHEMRNDDAHEVAATTTLKAVHLDTAARKSCAFPPAVIDRARRLIAARAHDAKD